MLDCSVDSLAPDSLAKKLRADRQRLKSVLLRHPGAGHSLKQLCSAGCDERVILDLLHWYARTETESTERSRNKRQQRKLRMRQAAKTLRQAATILDRTREIDALHQLGSDVVIVHSGNRQMVTEIDFLQHVPGLLRAYASRFERGLRQAAVEPRLKQNQDFGLPLLAAYVKGITGNNHTKALTDLVNASGRYSSSAGGLSQEGLRKQLKRFQRGNSALWHAMNDVVLELRTVHEPGRYENLAGWLIQGTFDHLERFARRQKAC